MHRLCQPLTALQCLLELGIEGNDPQQLKECMQDSLRECVRAVAMMVAFRELLEMAGSFSSGAEPLDARAAALEYGFDWREPAGWHTPGNCCDPLVVKLHREGLDTVLLHVRAAIRSATDEPENVVWDAEATRGGDARVEGNLANSLGDVGGAIEGTAREAVAAEDGVVRFVWRMDFSGNPGRGSACEAAWLRECQLSRPFDVADFDFTRNPLPRLSMARVVAEAMGGRLLCDASGVEIVFQIAGGEHPPIFSQVRGKCLPLR